MDMKATYVVFRVVHLESITELKDASECLPWILCLQPFQVVAWVRSYTMNDFFHVFCKLSPFIKRKLILSPLVCQMDLEPPETLFSYSFAIREVKDSAFEIITHVVQVRSDWVHTTAEVTVVRKVELLALAE